MVDYDWSVGFPSRKVNPQAAGEFLEKLRERNRGYLDADAVVESARSKRSPIHRLFEWDDSKAAIEFRREQARGLLRAVVTVYDDEEHTTRAFVTVIPDGGQRQYTSSYAAMSDPELRRQVLDRAFRELESFQDKYRDLTEFSKLFNEAKRVRRQHEERPSA